MSRPKLVDLYALTESLSERARHQRALREIEALVRQGHAEWMRAGTAARLTEPIKDWFLTRATITDEESQANAGLGSSASRIAIARDKVAAWPSVCERNAPLPIRPDGIRAMSREEFERFPVFQLYGQAVLSLGTRPVDNVLLKNRTHLFDNDFVLQHYEDDEPESSEETQERLYGVPIGCREGDVSELEA